MKKEWNEEGPKGTDTIKKKKKKKKRKDILVVTAKSGNACFAMHNKISNVGT